MKVKIKEEYILQNIAGSWIVLDTNSKSVNFNKLLSLNDSAKFLWEQLCDGAETSELAQKLADEFGIESDRASADCEGFICELEGLGCLDHVD